MSTTNKKQRDEMLLAFHQELITRLDEMCDGELDEFGKALDWNCNEEHEAIYRIFMTAEYLQEEEEETSKLSKNIALYAFMIWYRQQQSKV